MAQLGADRRFALACRGRSLDTILNAARRAEDLGYESVWIGGDGLADDVDPFVAAAAVLQATTQVRCGPGIVNAAESHPVALVRATLTLERIAPGRAQLGVGRGDPVQLAERLGLPTSELGDALEDALRICGPLLRGERVDHQGRYWSAAIDQLDGKLLPATPVPLALAAVGERTLRLGGRLASTVLLNYGASLDYVPWALAQISAGAAEAGRQRHDIEVGGFLLVARTDVDDPVRAIDTVRRTLAQLFADPHQAAGLSRPDGVIPREWDEPTCARYAAIGTRDQCLERVDRYLEAGLDWVILLPSGMRQLHGS